MPVLEMRIKLKIYSIRHLRSRPLRQGGATLIEALVSLLLFSLGLLGIAGLQVNALTFQKGSWATHRIAEVTADIGERMRANPDGVELGRYAYAQTYATAKSATITSNNCRTSGSACNGIQVASDDISAWLGKAQRILPQGAVRLEGSADDGYIVTVMYLDKDFTDATTGTPLSASATCTSTTTGIAWRNCCPAAAAVPEGIKCSRSMIQPFVPE
jgi:type IV pilus assembly protein PilV